MKNVWRIFVVMLCASVLSGMVITQAVAEEPQTMADLLSEPEEELVPAGTDENGVVYGWNVEGTGIVVTDYIGTSENVIIPDTWQGCPVVEIGIWAFAEKSIKTIQLPQTLEVIGFSAFISCTSLEGIVIPEGVTTIEGQAFSWCEALRYVGLPESLRLIDHHVFTGCLSLSHITIPGGVKRIADHAFAYNPGLEIVELEYGIEEIGWGAFTDCSGLKQINLPSSLKLIDDSAFDDCSSLQVFVWPESLEIVTYGVFARCDSLTEVMIPDTVKGIDIAAFYQCGGLKSIVLPEGVISVADLALAECPVLDCVVIPSTVQEMYPDTFKKSPNVTIYGYEGSYAETFAREQNIPFKKLLDLPFTDVSPTDWFYDEVGFVYEENLMVGTAADRFSPEVVLSRGQFVTILHRLSGMPDVEGENVFSDVSEDSWYRNAALWAQQIGVVQGYPDGRFGPEDPITREQMAVMMYRYADQNEGYDVSLRGDFSIFDDGDMVSEYAEEAMQWAVGSGLIRGQGENVLNPVGQATRAECATIIKRLVAGNE